MADPLGTSTAGQVSGDGTGTTTSASLQALAARRDSLMRRRETLVTRVSAGDKSVQYDLTVVGEAIAQLDREIAAAGGAKKIRKVLFVTGKGL